MIRWRGRNHTAGEAIKAILRYGVMLFIVVICIFPLIWVFLSSFKTNSEIMASAFSIPRTPSFVGYKIAMQTAALHLRFLTSLIVASSTTALAILIYGMAAYALARIRFPFRSAIFALLISSLLIPTNAMIQPVYTVIKAFGLYDTKLALILVYTAFAMPISLYLLRSYFLSIPNELEEAAYIEGAGFFRTFRSIILPVAKPVLASASVLTFIASWNELLYALLLTASERNRTLPLTMKYFTQMFTFNYTPMFAALVVSVLPTIVIYIVMQEQIMESIVAGSVKG